MSGGTEQKAGYCRLRGNRTARLLRGSIFLLLIGLFFLVMLSLNTSTSVADSTPCDCFSCHGEHHAAGWSGCSGCHDSPPQTGTHRVHYNSDPLTIARYADTSVNSTVDAYIFGCGNCHPLDSTKHLNGTVDVELYNAGAPAGSLKAKNPSSAAHAPGGTRTTYPNKIAGQPDFSYTNGTCSNVYCHSGYTITSGTVGLPLTDSLGNAILDADGNLTYAPYTVTYSRVYKATPAWGTSGTFSTCAECHAFPLSTSYPSVQAGVGDSHQWIDDYGYGNLHAFNMGYDPLSCRTCHYVTVTQANTWTRNPGTDVITYNPVPLASRIMHVNGVPDVAFDTTNPVLYTSTYNLNSAAYNPGTKTCSTVACHQEQQKVKWGSPYRWWIDDECNMCHQF